MMRVAAAMMALLVCGVTTAATINVPADYTTIQAAVDAASNGDEILVAPGTYTDTQDGHVVDMKAKAITLRSTDGAAVTIIDGQNARRGIACYQGETNATVIDGFTITNGDAVEYDYNGDGDIDWWEESGGGIYCEFSSPTITGCAILNNTATYDGGGILCDDSSPTITDCTISGNTATYNGGGIYCWSSSSPTISGCTISGNTATYSGGGIYCWSSSSPTISGCTISDNTAYSYGGGISCYDDSSLTLTDCTISGNTANGLGGGIYCSGGTGGSSPTLTDCTISDNTASSGGGIYCYYSSPTITGCTISDNTATYNGNGGGIYCSSSSSPTLTDTVVCGNDPDQINGSWSDNGSNTVSDECQICSDTNSDAVVDKDDVLAVLAAWGSNDPDADVDSDGLVGVLDLITVLASWGPCP